VHACSNVLFCLRLRFLEKRSSGEREEKLRKLPSLESDSGAKGEASKSLGTLLRIDDSDGFGLVKSFGFQRSRHLKTPIIRHRAELFFFVLFSFHCSGAEKTFRAQISSEPRHVFPARRKDF
jgi:hypothetical protein